MEHDDYLHLRKLLSIEGIGPVKVRNLLSYFHDFAEIFNAPVIELQRVEGIHLALAKRIRSLQETGLTDRELLHELDIMQTKGIGVFTYWHAEYPESLKNIYDPPLILYRDGKQWPDFNSSVAIVGTRNPTQYGKHTCARIAKELCESGLSVISGLARGIDTAAHNAVLQNSGSTYAVVGTGLDTCYPPENDKLARQIREQGAIISEFPFGTKPDAGNFPRRNRIISGLSKAVIIVETGVTGGAMITANLAADQGRDVYAVPGNLGVMQSEGTNQLIKLGGAKLFNNMQDLFEDMGIGAGRKKIETSARKMLQSLSLFEQKIVDVLSDDPLSIDKIAAQTSLPVSDCLVHLLSLEFKGILRQMPGKMFRLN
ncbi:MAG: DNA-processing protein DprA [Ignavibacteria bacterium]|nr:DNA-processing protein DprA [Ignavibacteria bacterium]